MDLIFKQTELRFLDDVTPEALKKEREDQEKRRRKKYQQQHIDEQELQHELQQKLAGIKINLPDGQEMQIDLAGDGVVGVCTEGDEEAGVEQPPALSDQRSKPRVQIADELVTLENEQHDENDVNKPLISVAQLKRSQPGDHRQAELLDVLSGEKREPIEYDLGSYLDVLKRKKLTFELLSY